MRAETGNGVYEMMNRALEHMGPGLALISNIKVSQAAMGFELNFH